MPSVAAQSGHSSESGTAIIGSNGNNTTNNQNTGSDTVQNLMGGSGSENHRNDSGDIQMNTHTDGEPSTNVRGAISLGEASNSGAATSN